MELSERSKLLTPELLGECDGYVSAKIFLKEHEPYLGPNNFHNISLFAGLTGHPSLELLRLPFLW